MNNWKNYTVNIGHVKQNTSKTFTFESKLPLDISRVQPGVSSYQRYLLKHLTKTLNLAFDLDRAGNKIDTRLSQEFDVRILKPPVKDFGSILEDEYLKDLYLKERGWNHI